MATTMAKKENRNVKQPTEAAKVERHIERKNRTNSDPRKPDLQGMPRHGMINLCLKVHMHEIL